MKAHTTMPQYLSYQSETLVSNLTVSLSYELSTLCILSAISLNPSAKAALTQFKKHHSFSSLLLI